MDIIKTRFEEHIALAQLVAQSEIMQQVADAAAIIKKALAGGHKVLFCGNGGSAADSQHLAAEFVGRFQKERNGIAGIALTVDTSILTAVANDYGYDRVFSRQVEALGQLPTTTAMTACFPVRWKLSGSRATCWLAFLPAATVKMCWRLLPKPRLKACSALA